MRILIAGASGVLGRATLRHLGAHDVVGLTRSPEKLEALRDLGAEPVLCDVYDYETLLGVMERARPRIVVNFLTDLSAGSAEANNRIRSEGATNLLNAATAIAAHRSSWRASRSHSTRTGAGCRATRAGGKRFRR
jgi:nucleoside-diphosphate-sugar epimerase